MAIIKHIAVLAGLAAAWMPSHTEAADLDAKEGAIECGGYTSVAVGVSDGAAGARVARFTNFSMPHQFRSEFGPHYRVTMYDPDLNCSDKPKYKRRYRTRP